MKIKTLLRKLLMEKKHLTHKNEFGCVMIYIKKDKEWDDLLARIDDSDLYQPSHDPSYGKEDNPHVTILFGVHNDVPDGEVENKISKIKPISINLKGISAFKNEKFEVLKFDVDSSDLHKLNKDFSELPHTTNYPNYHPHVTIAYLKPNMADKYINMLKDVDFKAKPKNIVYSKADDTKKVYVFKK